MKNEENNTGHDENHEMHEISQVNDDIGEVSNMTEETTNVRRSSRPRKQRMIIDEEEIGDFDDENDPDYM